LNPDQYLPKAHTCFFSINLPEYTSKEVGIPIHRLSLNMRDQVMASRIRYAISNCTEMDADFKLADCELTGWMD
jgi:hypothetical protein